MAIFEILRNGRLYDSMESETHDVVQIARSYAHDDTGAKYVVRDEFGENVYECEVTVNPPACWKVSNGPFFTGGERIVNEHPKQ